MPMWNTCIRYFTGAELPPGSKSIISWVPTIIGSPQSPGPLLSLAQVAKGHGNIHVLWPWSPTPLSCCYGHFFILLLFKKGHMWVVGTWVILTKASFLVHISPEVETIHNLAVPFLWGLWSGRNHETGVYIFPICECSWSCKQCA